MTGAIAPDDSWRLLPNAPARGTLLPVFDTLAPGQAREVRFGVGRSSFSLIAVALEDGARAYVNRCPHFGLPLNAEPDTFIGERGLLRCFRHFALFRLEDGHCVLGACEGEALEPIPVTRDETGAMRVG